MIPTLQRVVKALAEAAGGLVAGIPGGIGSRARIAYWRSRGARVGRGVRIGEGVAIDGPSFVAVGDGTWIDRHVILIAGPPRADRETRYVREDAGLRGRIEIGRRCHVGPGAIVSGLGGVRIADDVTLAAGTKVYSLSHHYRSWTRPDDTSFIFGSMAPPERQSMIEGPVTIGANVGVGADVLILPGTSLAEDSFVRPRAVVAGAWPPNVLLSGSPARREGPRFARGGHDA